MSDGWLDKARKTSITETGEEGPCAERVFGQDLAQEFIPQGDDPVAEDKQAYVERVGLSWQAPGPVGRLGHKPGVWY